MIRLLIACAVLALAACGPDLTDEEKAASSAAKKAELDAKQATTKPLLVTEQDGVRLWRVWDVRSERHVYFTTRGDVGWEETRRSGKVTRTDRYQVPGSL